MILLKDFFVKHQPEFSLMTCLKVVEKHLEKAKKECKESEEHTHCLKALAETYEMIEDIFNELGVNPETLI